MNAPLWVAAPVIVLVAVATRADVRRRKIPNAITAPAVLLALAAHAAAGGAEGVRVSLAGMLLAGGLLLPGWLLGWMGAGDVKLMAAVGAWLAYPQAALALLAALAVGGVMALVTAARHGVLGRALGGAARIGAWAALRASGPPPATTGVRFPFAAAAAAGAIIALWIGP
jgi:prepilin peptidase CpaA